MNTQDSSRFHPSIRHTLFSLLLAAFCTVTPHAGAATVDVKELAINGGIEDGKARLVIEAMLGGQTGDRDKLIHSTTLHHHVRATRDRLTHHIAATFDILQGHPRELTLRLQGEGHIREVTGESLESWSIRTGPDGDRNLMIHPRRTDPPLTRLTVTIRADQDIAIDDTARPLFTLSPTQPALLNGYLRLESAPDLELKPENPSGLIPIETRLLPDNLRIDPPAGAAEPLAFQFHGAPYSLPLRIAVADPEARRVVLRNFKLEGELTNDHAAFTLTAIAHLKNPDGGELVLLTGNAALTDVQPGPGQKVRFENGRFILSFEEPGEHPIRVHFHATVHSSDGWNSLDFGVAASVLQPLILNGLPEETQFRFPGAARPERIGDDFVSYLPADGSVRLSWKAARPELEGRLFYAANMLSQIIVSPGLMRQTALLDFKVMQGELNRVELILRGNGEVTRVQGGSLLSWNLLPIPDSQDRRLVVELNQAQRDQFSILVQMQTPIGAFPQTVDALELRPEGATRFAGHFRIVNEGAVRLEVAESSGLSQISPEQFPESDATRALLSATGSQRFAYRFSSPDFALRIQADQILPEISVSQVLAYHLGETELAIDAEFELDIREAPLRELLIRVPRGYPIARLVAPGLSDYFLVEPESETDAELRLVYGEPVSGRQIIQLRLERNASLGETNWPLPRVEVLNARSTRGQVAASADPGFRLTPERIVNLTELATAFFPKQLPGIQAAFRLSEPNWELTLRVERLPQSVQADAFHLFSIGEGIAYGSSVINYVVSGAPISSFRIALSGEYFNVEFTGQDVRNWQATDGGYLVHLHTPVAGAYTLLATYERPFRSQGETLAFTGARPLDAQSEQGHTLVTSAYQFDVTPVDVSSGLLPLEPGEVPPEYRLFFDAPILAAYRYTSRPFNLSLALSPLAQGDSLSLVVDRASLVTRISKEGQVITDARYFVKNRGNTHFRIVLPEGTELWSATVNGAPVVPVTDARANLIPLPQQADPDTVLQLDLKLAERSERPERVQVAAPIVSAPVMLAQWTVEPDAGRRLLYRDGSLTPASGLADASGFAQLARVFKGSQGAVAAVSLVSALALMVIAAWVWRWTAQNGLYKFSARHLLGTLLGAVAFAVALGAVMSLAEMAGHEQSRAPGSLTFLAPVQQAGSALHVQVANVEADAAMGGFLTGAWPALLAIAIWLYTLITDKSWFKPLGRALGWTLLAWAALRIPNGAPVFFSVGVLFLLLHVLIPAGRRLWQLPPKPAPEEPPSSTGSTAPIATSLLIGGLLWLATTPIPSQAQPSQSPSVHGLQAASTSNPHTPPLAQSVTQQLRIDEDFASGSATIQWTARKGELLPLLFEPAVLTGITYPSNSLKLVQTPIDGRHARQLLALESGGFTVELQYQIHVRTRDGETGIALPTHHGLVNRLELTLPGLDMDVLSQEAVSVQRRLIDNDTIASLILAPVNDAWITWKPRSRDVKSERPVFYAELFQLHVPAGGAIEGIHRVAIRPAQGELEHLTFIVPDGMTIIDVFDRDPTATTIDPASGRTVSPLPSNVSLWRFDPDARRLRVNLATPQSRPFTLHIRSQVATGPLPFEQSLGLIAVEESAGQIGLFGLATGNEVQIDSVNLQGFSPINLEDFPEAVLHPLYNLFPGLTVRRAWRYADPGDTATVAASAVEPDVRVESQSTLSLGEDRIVLATDAAVEITRAGIFRLSFLMPDGLDVESISSPALSHWTALNTDEGRIVTLHLNGKTEGSHSFAISLSGPGIGATNGWNVPRLILREASKQRGTLVIVPEQGMRLQPIAREGVTQLDPQRSGIRQRGVLAFRLLQVPWTLTLDVEQVDAWVQVTSLQHATVTEAQLKVAANLQYQIENTGLKSLRVLVPTNSSNVRFSGDQVADFLPVAGSVTNGLQEWEIKLHRRVIGPYLLQVTWQTLLPEQTRETSLQGVQAAGVNLQRGFVTLQAGGRLQVRTGTLPSALQPTEWQSIPRALQENLDADSASFAFRLVEPSFELPLILERHDAARLLPARVNRITLTSVISDDGVMLTQARLELLPGDKRLLKLTLPEDAQFWFAFVNRSGVWPWRDQDQILIPLEQQTKTGEAIPVEVFYTTRAGTGGRRALDLQLFAPKFDLPLENITWRVHLSEKWEIQDWSGTLQLQEERLVAGPAAADLGAYLQNEASLQMEKTQEAEQLLARGNTLLQQGAPQEARRAFQAAYGLSQHDDAFNEDARVQLHNLKLQQALIGLNFRQSAATGDTDVLGGRLRDLQSRKELNYTQQDAQQIIAANTADANAAFMRLAERLIQQQDAAVVSPAAIRATVPEQGRMLTFQRAVVVDSWADLNITLEATAAQAAPWGLRFLTLAAMLVIFAAFAHLGRAFRRHETALS